MNKNEIALSFEQAEYYTLQEACDYLNMKHGITNITPRKLLKNALVHDMDIFLNYSINYDIQKIIPKNIELSIYKDKDFQKYISQLSYNERQDIFNELEQIAIDSFYNEDMQSEISFGQYFFQVGYLVLRPLLANSEKTTVAYFENMIHEYDLLVKKEKTKAISRFKFMEKDITIDNFLYLSIEIYDKNNINILKNSSPYEYEIENNCINYHIGINDLIIVHDDLVNLENNIINNRPEQKTPFEIIPRQGKSIGKQTAQEQAKIIAKALWNTDKDKKIRIKEMANIVYSELHDNGFMRDLPNDAISLKEWIKDIAPPYATTGGRPKNEP